MIPKIDMNNPRFNASVLEAILSRRTIYEFRPDPIPEESIWRILEAGIWAPNHRLTQPWRFIVVGETTRSALAQALIENSTLPPTSDAAAIDKAREQIRRKVSSQPVLIAVACAIEGDVAQQTEDLAAVCAAIQNMQLAAWAEGIGSHWNTGRVTRLPETDLLLGLSEHNERLAGFLYLGYPAKVPDPAERKPIEYFVRRLR